MIDEITILKSSNKLIQTKYISLSHKANSDR